MENPQPNRNQDEFYRWSNPGEEVTWISQYFGEFPEPPPRLDRTQSMLAFLRDVLYPLIKENKTEEDVDWAKDGF